MATLTTNPPPSPATARRETATRAPRIVSPRVDIYETDKAYVLLADMPGVPPEGLDVEAERDTLVIRGRVTRHATPPDYQEFELTDYQRSFVLTEDLDTGGISATLRDGVLRIEIPKRPEVQPKKIPVRAE
jgi:HSP20 family molecular chaperone IbpA